MYKDPNVKSIAEILKKDDKCVGEAKNSLSEFIRKILAYNRISQSKIGKLVDAWTVTRFQPNDKLRSSAKSNALKALADNEVTWNTFLRFCQILNFKRVNLTLQIETHDDQVQFYQSAVINTEVRPGEEGYASIANEPKLKPVEEVDLVRRLQAENALLKQRFNELGYADEVKKIEDSVGV